MLLLNPCNNITDFCIESTHGNKGGDGYYRFRYKVGDEQYVHRWVYKKLNGPLNVNEEIRHLCNNRGCITYWHLWKGSRQDNVNDAVRQGRHIKGQRVHTSILTEQQVLDLRRLREEGLTILELIEEFGVAQRTVYNILNRTTWKHL